MTLPFTAPPIRTLKALLLISLAAALPARAQDLAPPAPKPAAPAAAPLAYDAVAIKPNKSGSGSTRFSTHDATFQATNASLKMLVVNAFGIRDGLISGLPSWAESARFDINAKVIDPDMKVFNNLSRDQRRAMLATVLADRFQIKVHTETKILPVYDLILARDGPKFKENSTPPPPPGTKPSGSGPGPGGFMTNNGELTGNTVPIASLITTLEGELDRTIVDKTGLTAKYDLHMKWTPDNAPQPLPEDAPPPLFTALQEQLGLKLQPSKGPVVTLVVDRVEMPSEN